MSHLARFERVGIGGKLTLGFGALAALTLLMVALAYVAGRNATDDINRTEEVRGPASLVSAEAQASLLRMQSHLRGYLVLSDPQDAQAFAASRQEFERNLAALQTLSADWGDDDDARRLRLLKTAYGRWAQLPQQLFDLHDNPLQNRPALRLARIELQPRRVRVLDEVDALIQSQKARPATPENRSPAKATSTPTPSSPNSGCSESWRSRSPSGPDLNRPCDRVPAVGWVAGESE